MMMHEPQTRSSEQQPDTGRKDMLADQIMQLLQDIGFLPSRSDDQTPGRLNEKA